MWCGWSSTTWTCCASRPGLDGASRATRASVCYNDCVATAARVRGPEWAVDTLLEEALREGRGVNVLESLDPDAHEINDLAALDARDEH